MHTQSQLSLPGFCVRAIRTPQSLTVLPAQSRNQIGTEKSMRKACVFLLVTALLVLGQPPRATIFGGVRGILHDLPTVTF